VLNSTLANRWARLLQKAKYRSIPVEITRREWEAIVADPCHYCGGPLEPTGYGLDRKDTHGAYTLTNVVPCCQACNRRKKDQPYDFAAARIRQPVCALCGKPTAPESGSFLHDVCV
jgi:hypothetical protein